MRFYIPEKINLHELEEKIGNNITPYKTDKLAYILDLFSRLGTYDKRYFYEDGYIPLNAEILQDRIGANYRQYIDALIENKIIVSNNSYVVGKSSKKYKLCSDYSLGLTEYETTDYKFTYNLAKAFEYYSSTTDKKYEYLEDFFNKIEINEEVALNYLKEDYELKIKYPYLRTKKIVKGRKKIVNPSQFYNCSIRHIKSIRDKNFGFKTDEKGYRLHSTLTNLPSVLRNALTYNGEELVSIDIKNSQPYFSTILFNYDFWAKKMKTKRYIDLYNIIIENNNISPSIMLLKVSELLDSSDVQIYVKLVCDGEFYEYFISKYYEYFKKLRERVAVKKIMFNVLFSKDEYILNPSESKGKTLFKFLFPNVYRLFSIIKNGKNSTLALLLQRIESEMVLDDICLTANNSKIKPLYTIHDSIATTKNNTFKLEQLMISILTNKMGKPPVLKSEGWNVDNIQKALNELKLKI